MRIALDFGGTFDQDPKFWTAFCGLARQYSHDVTMVTRADVLPFVQELADQAGIPVVGTQNRPKSHVFEADVWIDDQPQRVHA